MTLSDAALNASMERRHWVCRPDDDGKRVTWVLLAFGKVQRFRRGRPEPMVPTLAELTSDLWRISPRGPRTSSPRRKLRSP